MFLNVGEREISFKDYLDGLKMGRSQNYQKIKNDTSRTLTSDAHFNDKVTEDMLVRVLNVFEWMNVIYKLDVPYVQGMNVIAAPFLYVCESESMALALFRKFIETECPFYLRPSLDGVHQGFKVKFTKTSAF